MFKLVFPSEATSADICDGSMGVRGMPFNLPVGEGVLLKETQQGRKAYPWPLIGEESLALFDRGSLSPVNLGRSGMPFRQELAQKSYPR